MRSVVTEKGEQGAITICVIAPGPGWWYASTTRTQSSRIAASVSTTESGGSPPSLSPRLIDPREAISRIPTSAAAATSSSRRESLGKR